MLTQLAAFSLTPAVAFTVFTTTAASAAPAVPHAAAGPIFVCGAVVGDVPELFGFTCNNKDRDPVTEWFVLIDGTTSETYYCTSAAYSTDSVLMAMGCVRK
ncbi:hypothetical protein ACODT3_40220 [Streptomyces sp. 4.24]|uniref:hypothetical protein n=1 Tax=Streptomyces tritrimontium TaxID=3406573 RepID=UPI003BB7A7B0